MLDAKKKQGKVVIGKDECLVGEMTNETRESLKQCKESEVLVLENITEDNSDAICVSQTTEKARKAVCVDECGGKTKCAQLCNQRGDAMTADHKQVTSTINLEEIFPGTHFVLWPHARRLARPLALSSSPLALRTYMASSTEGRSARSTQCILHACTLSTAPCAGLALATSWRARAGTMRRPALALAKSR